MVIWMVMNVFRLGIAGETESEVKGLSPDESKKLVKAYYMIGEMCFEAGSFQEAKQEFKKVLEHEPEHPGARRYLKVIELQFSLLKGSLMKNLLMII